MSEQENKLRLPWTRERGTIRDCDGEFVAILPGNRKYMDAAEYPKAEAIVRAVNGLADASDTPAE